ncbi:MAG: arginine--tRNA ligase [Candidatus Dormibacteraceae bacterium]
MSKVTPIAEQLESQLRKAMATVLPTNHGEIDPQLRRSERADFQSNGSFAAAKQLGTNPRQLATQVVESYPTNDLLASCEVSGPGFINLNLRDETIIHQLAQRVNDPRLGVPTKSPQTIVVEYSSPNIAKEMHVGHLRGMIIGDALARVLGFIGRRVIRQDHLGYWGTQFGMLIQYLGEHPEHSWRGSGSVAALSQLYRTAREEFERDPAFADRARGRVVELQAGEASTLACWQEIVKESMASFRATYRRMGVLLTDANADGESRYNPELVGIAEELEQRGIAIRSQGALCVFFPDITGPEDKPIPLIVRKKDGGFGYAVTDLATLRHRVNEFKAERILYVVDSRQALHFRMVFATARRAGWLPDSVAAQHVAYGTILNKEGRPFKTRSGETAGLTELLDAATKQARQTITTREGGPAGDIELLAEQVGIGAVKYADLSNSRGKDYIFDLERMCSLSGNTGVYLQYAHARVRSILSRLEEAGRSQPELPSLITLAPTERALALLLDEFGLVINEVEETLEPHRLCTYLYSLAQTFTAFYESCPVLKAESEDLRAVRTLLCRLTADTLKVGLELLGIATPERL